MLILPLGVGRRFFNLPVVTFALVGVTILVSQWDFAKLAEFHREAVQTDSYAQAIAELGTQTCFKRQLNSKTCEIVPTLFARVLSPDHQRTDLKDLIAVQKKQNPDFEKDLRQLVKVIEDVSHLPSSDAEIRGLPAYERVIAEKKTMLEHIQQALPKYRLLGRSNITPVTVLWAQLTHANWMHLLGNFLLFFGLLMCLENRVGVVWLLLIYFAGGTAGLLTEVLWSPDAPFVIGASANLMAILGAFYALYFGRSFFVLLSLGFYNKVVEASVAYVIPLVFVLADVAGIMAQSKGETDGVAHLAHVVGFGVGGLLGLGLRKWQSLPASCLYPEEAQLLKKLEETDDEAMILRISRFALHYNASNWQVMQVVLTKLFKNPVHSQAKMAFVQTHLSEFIEVGLKFKQSENVQKVLELCPLEIPWSLYLKGLPQACYLQIATDLRRSGRFLAALRMYDCYQHHFPRSINDAAISQLVTRLIEKATPSFQEELERFRRTYPQNSFIDLLNEKMVPAA